MPGDYDLSTKKEGDRCVTIELRKLIGERVITTKKSLDLAKLRILTVLFLVLLTPADACPTTMLQLRLKDIRAVLARDLGKDQCLHFGHRIPTQSLPGTSLHLRIAIK